MTVKKGIFFLPGTGQSLHLRPGQRAGAPSPAVPLAENVGSRLRPSSLHPFPTSEHGIQMMLAGALLSFPLLHVLVVRERPREAYKGL